MIAILVAALLGAPDLQTIEAEGQGALSLGHTRAVQLAKDTALRQVVLSACKQVAAADPKVAQCAIADDRLFAGFAGVVSKFDVLSEEKAGDVIKVKVRAQISLKAVTSDELEAQRLYKRIGTLRLSLGLLESVERKGFPAVQGGEVGMKLTEFFKADGWRIHAMAPLDGSDVAAVQAAAKADATDYALVGPVTTARSEASSIKGKFVMIDVAAGRVIETVDLREVDWADLTKESARDALVAAVGRKLRGAVIKALREAEVKGTEVALTVTGVKDAAAADALLARLQTVVGVLEAWGELEGTTYKAKLRSSAPAKDLARALGTLCSITSVRSGAIEGAAK